jgi:hypothetical protein
VKFWTMSRPKKKAAHDNKERLLIARFDLSLVARAGLNWGRAPWAMGLFSTP